jgi:hypothetical protein
MFCYEVRRRTAPKRFDFDGHIVRSGEFLVASGALAEHVPALNLGLPSHVGTSQSCAAIGYIGQNATAQVEESACTR